MDRIAEPLSTTFEDLPGDCLRLIIDEVVKIEGGSPDDSTKNIKNLSCVNRHLRELCIPLLFPIYNLYLEKRPEPSLETFRALLKAPFVTTSLWTLTIHLLNSTQLSDQAFCDSFVGVLAAMTSLSELSLVLNNDDAVVLGSKLDTSLSTSGAWFPSIQILELVRAPDVPEIVMACPSVELLKLSDSYMGDTREKMFQVLPSVKTLRRLDVDFW
ncbi:hypothetical protein A1O7_02139 [Cladophialophora yegresii CBS 114405]|uniref:F-box domain-containing protein n=1 Tax=Cladophialophora yegresii CBS 114405 TaxID=1182544 RepID=W9W9N6_9EURO|nr:uncharacterized protein A1O7_02139 [Cladophialophora yegresii CBS 114405]EXJ61710.1 hypothetical protein A1O7_02139 [Cladophialophora yegresii CBS 114405]